MCLIHGFPFCTKIITYLISLRIFKVIFCYLFYFCHVLCNFNPSLSSKVALKTIFFSSFNPAFLDRREKVPMLQLFYPCFKSISKLFSVQGFFLFSPILPQFHVYCEATFNPFYYIYCFRIVQENS